MGKEIGGSLERGWKGDEEGEGALEEAEEAAGRMKKVRRRMRRSEEVWKRFGGDPQLRRLRTTEEAEEAQEDDDGWRKVEEPGEG